MQLRHFLAAALAALTVATGAHAGVPAMIAHVVDSVLSERTQTGASWSMLFYSLTGDSVIYERDADRLLTPASVTKLFSSAAALDALGPDYQFTTNSYVSGSIDAGGILRGNLILSAGGDPTAEMKASKFLGGSVMQIWADSLAAHGIRRIAGNLILRTRPYRLSPAASEWETGDVNAGFAPPVDGFGYNNNVCHLEILPGESVGDPAHFVLDPPFAPVGFRSQIVTSPATSSPDIQMWPIPHDSAIIVSGEIPQGDDGEFLWIPVQDPALYYGYALRDALVKRGIGLDGSVIVSRGWSAQPELPPFYSHNSPPLRQILALMNKESDNYTAEYILAALGIAVAGSSERRRCVDAVERFAVRCGADPKSFYLEDGCGLARQDIVNARAVVKLLAAMRLHPNFEVFRNSLAVSGYDGTLSYRLSTANLAGRIFGKTGTMTHVCCIAGYADTLDGTPIAFAMLCNNFRCTLSQVRLAQDFIIEQLLANYP